MKLKKIGPNCNTS